MKGLPELRPNHRMKHNLCSFTAKNARGNAECTVVLPSLLTNQDETG